MKYGYLFYRKPLPSLRKERPINLGDPIQSIAVINLYKEMGISEDDIIPIERYDVANYDEEEAILTVNGAESYEHYAYNTSFLPPSPKLTPVYFSLYLERELEPDVLKNLRKYGPVGCRDMATALRLTKKDCETYVTGCVTMTFPKRQETDMQKSIFLVECPSSLDQYLPEYIKNEGIRLSATERLKSVSTDTRMTKEETWNFHRMAQERLDLLRDHAKLVITSRFHTAAPAIAMGIPVILVRTSYDPRFEILEKYVPFYTPDTFHEIDWNPLPIDIENEKNRIKEAFFTAVRFAVARKGLEILYTEGKSETYQWPVCKAVPQIPFSTTESIRYAVWGVCLPPAQLIVQEMSKLYPSSKLFAAIDTYQSGKYMNVSIIHPDKIDELPDDVIIVVAAPSAHTAARNKLEHTSRKFVLIQGVQAECYHFDE